MTDGTTTSTPETETPVAVTASEPVKPVEGTTTATADLEKSIEQQKLEAQAEYEERLKDAEEAYLEASIVVVEITKELKEAKKVYKA